LELRDLGDEHVAIAGAAARLAAQRSTADEQARIAQYLDALASATTRQEQRRADARFHIEIAVAAQSVRLTHAETRLQAEIGEWLWLPVDGFPGAAIIEQEHRAMLEAISAGDSNLAGALAEAHVTRGIKRLINLRLSLLADDG